MDGSKKSRRCQERGAAHLRFGEYTGPCTTGGEGHKNRFSDCSRVCRDLCTGMKHMRTQKQAGTPQKRQSCMPLAVIQSYRTRKEATMNAHRQKVNGTSLSKHPFIGIDTMWRL